MRLRYDPSRNGHMPIAGNAVASRESIARDDPATVRTISAMVRDYIAGLASSQIDPTLRAREPFGTDPWVSAAAMAVASTAIAAPLRVYVETESERQWRHAQARSRGRAWDGPKRGEQRNAYRKHTEGPWSILRSIARRSVEIDWNHDIAPLLQKPNPEQTGCQFEEMLLICIMVDGEVGVVPTGKNGVRLAPGETPKELWPIRREMITPLYASHFGGGVVEWELRIPSWLPEAYGQPGSSTRIAKEDLILCKQAGPVTPIRGWSRVTAGAAGIEESSMLRTYMRGLLNRGTTPRAAFETDQPMTAAQTKEIATEIEQKYSGWANHGLPMILHSGLKASRLGLTPTDLAASDRDRSIREETLAVMNVPPSVVGASDLLSYASALVAERSLWSRTVRPVHRAVEDAFNTTLLSPYGDDTFVSHDLSQVEAARAGLGDRIDMAVKLTGDQLHMPPRVAYEIVGLEVPEYEGDDTSYVSMGLVPAEDISTGVPMPSSPGGAGSLDPDSTADNLDELPPEKVAESLTRDRASARGRANRAPNRIKMWLEAQQRQESRYRSGYRSWLEEEQASILRALREADSGSRSMPWGPAMRKIDLAAVLPNIGLVKRRAEKEFRPLLPGTLQATFDLTEEMDMNGGPASVDIGDDVFEAALDRHLERFLANTPVTVVKRLEKVIAKALAEGDSVQEMRDGILGAFGKLGSRSQSLMVSRTFSGSVMNGIRTEMFSSMGFENWRWVASPDENTRVDHQKFAAHGVVKIGFDFLTLPGVKVKGGKLEFAGDTRAAIGQLANCRCLMVPQEKD